ncbi:MAG TPA: sulfotransferase, partial [Arenicellales bacterium]|nr:sulfotransferase [Arenicellales bacterium]
MLSNTGYRNDFEVDPWVHWLGKLVEQGDGLCRRAGGWETRMLSDPLAAMEIDRPVYIAGLARSGTTKLLEILSWHDDVVTHRYRDFPLLHVPYLWNRFLDFVPRRHLESRERAHRDGIYINPDSPEAFEEVLWMSFFPQLHDPAKNSVLDAHTSRPDFESFYRDHIRKLLLVRGGSRYVSKGNYNITRLEYLLRIFPGARFIIPVREPVWHIASLMKQHKLFCKAQKDNPKALTHLRRAGHFEFGLDRRPINTGDHEEVERILALWNSGREVDGWARYWDHTHAFIADRLAHNPAL